MSLLGPCYRRVPHAEPGDVYLTFDDGPDPGCTPAVLDCLEKHGAHATFFLVAEKARASRYGGLGARLAHAGHAIGNHSLDHRYGPFFSSKKRMLDWIAQADTQLTALFGRAPVAFRSPAGVRTPPLNWALKRLGIPLVHWSVRFYDTRFGFPRNTATSKADRLATGDIILLHDTHAGGRRTEFLHSLDLFLRTARARGLSFRALPRLSP